ncbi:MAG: hypothetical protein ACAH83_02650 [Alphaproteobacteria bacterium]
MPHHPKKRLRSGFEQAVAGSAYYCIFSVEPSPDEEAPGKWDVMFYISGSKDDVKALSPLSSTDVRRLLHLYYAFAADKPEYLGEESKNLHVARVDSKARAERLASELVYILQDAGLDPMKEDEGLYQPMAPESSRPKWDKPPRAGF